MRDTRPTDRPAPTDSFYDLDHNQLGLNCGIGSYDGFVSGVSGSNLAVSLRPVLSSETHGGEALLNADGEFIGVAVGYEFGRQDVVIECLPSTTILRNLSDVIH